MLLHQLCKIRRIFCHHIRQVEDHTIVDCCLRAARINGPGIFNDIRILAAGYQDGKFLNLGANSGMDKLQFNSGFFLYIFCPGRIAQIWICCGHIGVQLRPPGQLDPLVRLIRICGLPARGLRCFRTFRIWCGPIGGFGAAARQCTGCQNGRHGQCRRLFCCFPHNLTSSFFFNTSAFQPLSASADFHNMQ